MRDDRTLKSTGPWEPEPEPEQLDSYGRLKPLIYALSRQHADHRFDLEGGTCLLVKEVDEPQPQFAIFSSDANGRRTMIGHRRAQHEPRREGSRQPLSLEQIEWTTGDGPNTPDTHLQVVRAALLKLDRWFDVHAALAQLPIDRS